MCWGAGSRVQRRNSFLHRIRVGGFDNGPQLAKARGKEAHRGLGFSQSLLGHSESFWLLSL